jgi:hypothetical protein
MKRNILIIAGLIVIAVIVALASRDECEPGDPGYYLGGILIADCPQVQR